MSAGRSCRCARFMPPAGFRLDAESRLPPASIAAVLAIFRGTMVVLRIPRRPTWRSGPEAVPMSSAMLLGLLALSALLAVPLCAAEVTLHGRVVDENEAPVRAARVNVHPAGRPPLPRIPGKRKPILPAPSRSPSRTGRLSGQRRARRLLRAEGPRRARRGHAGGDAGDQHRPRGVSIRERQRGNLARGCGSDAKPGTPHRHRSKRHALSRTATACETRCR